MSGWESPEHNRARYNARYISFNDADIWPFAKLYSARWACSMKFHTYFTPRLGHHISIISVNANTNDVNWLVITINYNNQSINQSIETNLYSAMHRSRIRGAYRRTPGRLFTFTICNIEQFSFKDTPERAKQFNRWRWRWRLLPRTIINDVLWQTGS